MTYGKYVTRFLDVMVMDSKCVLVIEEYLKSVLATVRGQCVPLQLFCQIHKNRFHFVPANSLHLLTEQKTKNGIYLFVQVQVYSGRFCWTCGAWWHKIMKNELCFVYKK